MADNRISSFPIAELLKALNARPGTRKNTYHSPFREDKDASLHIDPLRNLWYDHGAGTGGGNVDLVMQCRRCTRREAAEFILSLDSHDEFADRVHYGGSGSGSGEKPGANSSLMSRILLIRDLRSPFLLEYAASRGIPESLASHYCKEVVVRGKNGGKTYDHIGFPNNAGGLALKSPSGFKSTTKSGVTTIDTAGAFSLRPASGTVTVFEGFFDFLSWLAKDKKKIPGTDACVLNSVSNLGRALQYLRRHQTVICCLDNDQAGHSALDTLRQELHSQTVIDGSLFYHGYKDVNEWWTSVKDPQ